jgi:tetrathionate reductase subunit B
MFEEEGFKESRRAFLKILPAITVGAATPVAAMATASGQPHWAMLIDLRKCVACQACTVACATENAAPEGSFRTIVSTYAVTQRAEGQQQSATYVLPRLCNHCDEPPCVGVCPVGASIKRKDGTVLVDGDRCVGCAYCVQACPYEARFINHDTGNADKCTLCAHRLEAGLLPACVESCVGGARIFGDLNNFSGELYRLVNSYRASLKVLKPEMKTRPDVFYLGLDNRFQGWVENQSSLVRPGEDRGQL